MGRQVGRGVFVDLFFDVHNSVSNQFVDNDSCNTVTPINSQSAVNGEASPSQVSAHASFCRDGAPAAPPCKGSLETDNVTCSTNSRHGDTTSAAFISAHHARSGHIVIDAPICNVFTPRKRHLPTEVPSIFIRNSSKVSQLGEDSFELKRRRLLSYPPRVFNTVRPPEVDPSL